MASKELSSSHRCTHRRIECFDVALFGHVRFCMAQDALHNFLIRTKFIQVRRNATRNPCQPYHSNSILYEWTDDLLGQLVQVHRPSVSGVSVAVASRGRAPPSLRTTGLRSRSISGLTFPRPTSTKYP